MNWKFWKNWFGQTETEKISLAAKEDSKENKNEAIRGDLTSQNEFTSNTPALNISTVYITENLLERTRELLASFARNSRSEGVVYWFGFEFEQAAVVTTLVVPDADTSWGCIRTTPKANAQALSVIVGTPLILLGQAHSHPGAGVRHSPTDDTETFASFDGAISVVVPNFGREEINLQTCGIHRHMDGAFRFIESSEISDHICVLPGEADFRAKKKEKGSKNISRTKS
ncbi:MAG TPA: hypothetical protein VF599_04525 [Pyrinomonadaceae bacterium]|jgi:hypothetical protein